MGDLFEELKRRKVFRVGAAYVVVGWLLAQVGDLLADNLAFPDLFMQMVLVVLVLGLPVALVLAWAFEITPDGIKRDVHASETVKPLVDLDQKIQFCQSDDGVRLAYVKTGAGPPIIRAATWMTHLEEDLRSVIWGHFIQEISTYRQLIRYDQRGNGLSDRKFEEISPSLLAGDLATVIDAAGVDKCALLGISQGAAAAIKFAAKHPDRVTHLVILGGFASGAPSEQDSEKQSALREMMRIGWGRDDPSFRQVFTSRFFPDGDKELLDDFDRIQRTTVTAETVVKIYDALLQIDVREYLSKVSVPTLVLHCKGDRTVPLEAGRMIASEIPGARFVPLDSNNHIPLRGEAAEKQLHKEIRDFLT